MKCLTDTQNSVNKSYRTISLLCLRDSFLKKCQTADFHPWRCFTWVKIGNIRGGIVFTEFSFHTAKQSNSKSLRFICLAWLLRLSAFGDCHCTVGELRLSQYGFRSFDKNWESLDLSTEREFFLSLWSDFFLLCTSYEKSHNPKSWC